VQQLAAAAVAFEAQRGLEDGRDLIGAEVGDGEQVAAAQGNASIRDNASVVYRRSPFGRLYMNEERGGPIGPWGGAAARGRAAFTVL